MKDTFFQFAEHTDIKEQRTIKGSVFPFVLTPSKTHKNITANQYFDWIAEHKNDLRTLMTKHGAVLFRDFPIDSPKAFETMLEMADFKNMPYVGGAAPRKQITDERVLTTNESPASEKIPFHHEMSQVPNPPSYIFFYCQKPSDSGGQTAILHSNEMYDEFIKIDANKAHEIESQGVKYNRVMPSEDDFASPIGRSWKSTFLTDSKSVAEEKMTEAGMSWQWLDNGDLRTTTATLPAVRTDERSGLKTFFNSMVAAYIGWQDTRNDRKKAVMLPNGEYMDDTLMETLAQKMEEKAVAFDWRKNDVLCIDNKLVLHSRYPFTGERVILASIATH